MDKRQLATFMVGFGLASLIAFLIIYLQLSPLESDLRLAEPQIKDLYDLTHSEDFSKVTKTSIALTNIAKQISSIPFIGEAINAEEISILADTTNTLVQNSKYTSEKLLPAIQNTLLAIRISFFGIWVSLIILLAGVYLAKTS